jgi:folate-binding Fe-S cluster repair protein YgfZ
LTKRKGRLILDCGVYVATGGIFLLMLNSNRPFLKFSIKKYHLTAQQEKNPIIKQATALHGNEKN